MLRISRAVRCAQSWSARRAYSPRPARSEFRQLPARGFHARLTLPLVSALMRVAQNAVARERATMVLAMIMVFCVSAGRVLPPQQDKHSPVARQCPGKSTRTTKKILARRAHGLRRREFRQSAERGKPAPWMRCGSRAVRRVREF